MIAAVDDPEVGADIARNAYFGLTGDAFDLSVGATREVLGLPPTQFVTVVVEAANESLIVTAFPALVS